MEWQPITQLPSSSLLGKCFLTINEYGHFDIKMFQQLKNGYIGFDPRTKCNIATHWMPLPQPPKGDAK